MAAAQEALGERWEAFLKQLRREDRELGGALQIHSDGGAVFMGPSTTGGASLCVT